MAFWNRSKNSNGLRINSNGLRIIETARDEESINKAVEKGYFPIVKKVSPSKKINSKFSVIQNVKTGLIQVISDYRTGDFLGQINDYKTVIEWTSYYPHNFKSPFAAYLIPKDIKDGERVFVEDLIEDYIGSCWNQGDAWRLSSCDAIWNGKDLEIQWSDDMAIRNMAIG